ncbi:23067_t:CDS:1, partial [Gigaspora margarita]
MSSSYDNDHDDDHYYDYDNDHYYNHDNDHDDDGHDDDCDDGHDDNHNDVDNNNSSISKKSKGSEVWLVFKKDVWEKKTENGE